MNWYLYLLIVKNFMIKKCEKVESEFLFKEKL